jgi:hypothetical protein
MFRYLTCTGDRKQLTTYMTAHICNKNTNNYIGSLDSTSVIAYMGSMAYGKCIWWLYHLGGVHKLTTSFAGFLMHDYFRYCKFYNFVLCIAIIYTVRMFTTPEVLCIFDNIKPVVTLLPCHIHIPWRRLNLTETSRKCLCENMILSLLSIHLIKLILY